MVLRRRPEKSSDDRGELSPVEKLENRMDALDRRLDNIDSMVTAVAERVMSQPIVVNVICPHCGKGMEISIIGLQKPTR